MIIEFGLTHEDIFGTASASKKKTSTGSSAEVETNIWLLLDLDMLVLKAFMPAFLI
jgi:hypothetical protein